MSDYSFHSKTFFSLFVYIFAFVLSFNLFWEKEVARRREMRLRGIMSNLKESIKISKKIKTIFSLLLAFVFKYKLLDYIFLTL